MTYRITIEDRIYEVYDFEADSARDAERIAAAAITDGSLWESYPKVDEWNGGEWEVNSGLTTPAV
jgi:hypothetical protein